uniref:MINDY deubiquitinase domain-containing protein n=1 Tax=Zea mays TaxID=4577 RepID=A0A804LSI8_MAIZE
MQLEQNLELSEFNKQVLGVLPKLTCSLYFDVTFSSSCGLEKTFETALFGFLGVPLRHGWLVDPQGPQLTRYGFSSLHNDLIALQPTVLIWNENLITISKFEDKIYVLLNDLSLFKTKTDAVWERLTHANGDGVFVDCNFVPTDSKIQSVLGDISFEPHETVVSMEYLLGLVLALLGGSVKMQDYSDERKSQILDVVKSLAGGFDMDVIFTRTDGFTMTQEWLLLDCLDLNLRHGWIAARDLLTGPEVSFESLTLASNEPGFPHAEEIKNFLRGPQLTPIGLVSLQEDFVENVPCILFWNKHYHTIVMINGVLNSLVTDSNYLETRIVWQTLDGVNGDGVYLDNNFTPVYVGLDAATSVYVMWPKIN